MEAGVVGVHGSLKGQRFTLGRQPITFGRGDHNDVVLPSERASWVHAELRHEDDAYVLEDRGSSNGTWVNGARVTVHQLQPGDEITIGDEIFRVEVSEPENTTLAATVAFAARNATVVSPGRAVARPLRVTVTGGGPVGLSFALLLEDLMGPQVDITVYDGRWTGRRQDRVEDPGPGQYAPAAGRHHPEPSVPAAPRRGPGAPVHPGRVLRDVADRPGLDRRQVPAQHPDLPTSRISCSPSRTRSRTVSTSFRRCSMRPRRRTISLSGTCSRSAKAAARTRSSTSPSGSASGTRGCTHSMASTCKTWFSGCG